MADEVPIESDEVSDEIVMVFTKTIDHGSGGSETMSQYFPLTPVGDVSVDNIALALLPVLENDGWVFQHIRVKTTVYSTYDPRNP